MKKVFAVLLCVVFLTPAVFAQAKSKAATVKSANGGSIAIGYICKSLAVRYALSDLLSLEGSVGFWAGDGTDTFTAGGRALYILKKYSDFNVYGFGGLNVGYESPDIGDNSLFVSPSAGAGIEYFIVHNLSVSAEMGVAANFQEDFNFVATFGDWLSTVGFRYYLD